MTVQHSPTSLSPSAQARVVHAALMLGVILFLVVTWSIGSRNSLPSDALPDRKVLYVALFLASASAFGGAMFVGMRLAPRATSVSPDEWWRAHMSRALIIWALVEAPALLGTVAYMLTQDFRTLIATFAGLFLFLQYRPARLAERV